MDLFIGLCREVDPAQTALDLGSYYTLRAFPRERAEAVLRQMFEPLHAQDPILRQQFEDFGKALVQELLRPPRDMRLNREDPMTVLPVELQIIGMMIESIGAE